jgi:division/cell wall cluster transcriptional repressor MraZ
VHIPSESPFDAFFSGTEEAGVDEKGRILICKEKRQLLGENFVMVHDPSSCIAVYPIWKLNEIGRQFTRANILSEGRAQFARMFGGNMAKNLKFDRPGRVVIPKSLREASGIELNSEVLVVGALDKVEIWNKDRKAKFDEFMSQHGETRSELYRWSYDEMMDSIKDGGE